MSVYNEMLDESPKMKARAQGRGYDRDARKMVKKFFPGASLNDKAFDFAEAVGYSIISFFDAITVTPIYFGTKAKMEAKYGMGAEAQRRTEKVISDTQPTSKTQDQSLLQLDQGIGARMMSFFMGFLMRYENQNRIFNRGISEKKIPLKKAVQQIVHSRLLPTVIMYYLFTLGAGDEPEADDLVWDILLYQFAGNPVKNMAATLAANVIRKSYDPETKTFSVHGNPISKFPEIVEYTTNTMAKFFRGDADAKDFGLAVVELWLAQKGLAAVRFYREMQESLRQFENTQDLSRWFKLVFKPDYKEKE
jgi:hypothetical protein